MLMPKSEAFLNTLEGYHYRLLRRIRKTRMSEVWLAAETTTGEQVIIKFARIDEFTDPNQRAILNDERWLRHLNHPSIIKLRPIQENPPARDPVYRARAVTWPGMPWFIVEPYLAGGSIADVLAQHGKFDILTALRIAKHMFEILVYLRQAGCVHKDIKLANWVFVLKFDPTSAHALMWQPMLIDFGIAENLGEKVIPAIDPNWAAPEVQQAYHARTLIKTDASWDVYGVALILQALLTGQPKPDLDPAKRYTALHLTRADLVRDQWITEHDLGVMEHKLNHLLERAINGVSFVRPQAEEFVAELDTLLQLIKPKPTWVYYTAPLFQWIRHREIQRAEVPVQTARISQWASILVMTFLVLLVTLGVIFGVPELPFPRPSLVSAGSNGASVITATQVISPSVTVNSLSSPPKEISNGTATIGTPSIVAVERPTNTATPSATAPRLLPTSTPVAIAITTTAQAPTDTATLTPTPTNTSTKTSIATPTNPEARVPVTPQPPSITESVTGTTVPLPRPTLDQRVIVLKSPVAGAAKNIDSKTKDREREEAFVWEYRSDLKQRDICAELVFNYPLHNQRPATKTEVVADVTNQTSRKVDLPAWFHDKNVQQSGFTFRWGVRIFYCGTSERSSPSEWRVYTLTQQ